ncbi:MAG: hypothetical protein NTZ08_02510, partial [Verrucomicrobia bacterium]|nr:hypothetical protein [Verrucomicrobiota bacterium]
MLRKKSNFIYWKDSSQLGGQEKRMMTPAVKKNPEEDLNISYLFKCVMIFAKTSPAISSIECEASIRCTRYGFSF